MGSVAKWTRRGFLATAGLVGGGLALGIVLAPNRLKMSDAAPEGQVVLNTWVRIAPDNTVTVIFPHSEMGQGVGTGLAQMLAEEMEADWAQVRIEQAPPSEAYINSDLGRGYILGEAAVPGFMNRFIDYSFLQVARFAVGQLTGGSTAIRLTGHYGMRRAGAAAKGMLIQAAAKTWGVEAGACRAEAGRVLGPGDKTATFGELASVAATFTPDLAPPLKDPKDYKIVGQAVTRLDLPSKVDGSAVFGIDVTVEGMAYAAVLLPPVIGARVASVDEAGLTQRPGLGRVLNLGDAIAVLADSYWTASRALEELQIAWDGGRNDLSSEVIATMLEAALDGAPELMIDEGSVGEMPVSASYSVPYLAHATMEPMNATVHVRPDGVEVWMGHQNVAFARAAVADHLRVAPETVVMHPTYLGGGFGRRGQMDALILAVRIAVEAGQPVKTVWSRETDMTHDWYRPTVRARLAGAVEGGKMAAFRHIYTHTDAGMPDGERPFGFPYIVPAAAIGRVKWESPVRLGAWRAVDFTQIGFFHEAFVDELAGEAGADPLQFRLDHLENPRMRAVVEKLRELSDWSWKRPAGTGIGMALVESFGSIVAQAVEVSVQDKSLRVTRVTSVVDCGVVVNPNAAEAQIQGAVIFGLTAALMGEITVEGGEVQQKNFPDYDMLRLANAPAQAVHFITSTQAPGGLGEPGTPPVAPALVNAIAAATGTRVRDLPVSRQGFLIA